MKASVHTLPLVGSIAAICFCGTAAANAQDHTWISPVTGVWSNSANWLGGIAPVAGGSSTLSIRFVPPAVTAADINATNDFAGDFLANALEFDSPISARLNVASPFPNTLVFSGTNSRITQSGAGAIALNGRFDPADGLTTVDGNGSGDITFSSLDGLTTGDTLRIAVGPDSPNGQLVTATANAAGGTLQLDSGNLSLKFGSNAANTKLRINGGTVRFDTSPVTTFSGSFELGGSLVLVNPNNTTVASAITGVAPGAGLQLRASGTTSTLTLTGASTYAGRTIVDVGVTSTAFPGDAGTLRLNGNGSLLNTSELDIRANGTLAIETSPSGVTNRVGDSTPVILRGGKLQVDAPTASASVQSEQIGAVSVSGFSSISIGPASRSVDLTAASLTRLDRGTVLFRSPTLTTPGTTPARILFNTAPTLVGGGGTGPNISIIPHAIGDNTTGSNGFGLVTYDPATGVRLLNNSTEYVSTLASATPTSNVRFTGGSGPAGDTTINSFFMALGGTGVAGTSTLTVSSGVILTALNSTTATATIGLPLNFGTAEGQIFTVNNTVIQRSISGSGGLTKSGRGMLTLQANSTFTGPLTINDGLISFNATGQLGADTGAIVMSNSAGLRYTGTGSVTFNRPLQLLSGYGRIQSATGSINLTQPISGPGGLRVGLSTTEGLEGRGTVRLSAANTYEGPTFVDSGTLEFANDSALGSGELWLDATVRLLGEWNANRSIRILGGTLNTNGFNATLNGEISGSDSFLKTGAGTLTLTKSSTFSGSITIEAGTLALSNQATIKSSVIEAKVGTSLVLDDTGTKGRRLVPSSNITLTDATLRVVGDTTIPTSEKIGTLTLSSNTLNTLELIRPGSASLSFTTTNLAPNFSHLIVRADNLGAPAATPNTRLIFDNPPPTDTGILPRIYVAPTTGSGQESFAKYQPGSDSAGLIGVQPLAAADYTSGPVLQHTAGTANFLVQPGTTAGGSFNAIRTLTFESGGTLTQSSGQALVLGEMLVRSGAPSSVTGGSIQASAIMAFGDLTLDATVTGSLEKNGPGTLILGTQPGAASITIGSGPWRPLSQLALALQSVALENISAVLDLDGATASVGALTGTGTIDLGGGALTVGTKGTDFVFNGSFPTPGQFIIVDGGNPNALRTLFLTSAPNGGSITLQSGRLKYIDSNTGNPQPLNLAGGVLELLQGAIFRSPLNLSGSATVRGEGYVTFPSSSIFTGPGSIAFDGLSGVIIQSTTTHTGETIISGESHSIQLEGTNGALLGTSAIRLNGGGLSVDYGGGSSRTDRIGDNTAIHIKGGYAGFGGVLDKTVTETTGPIFAYPGAALTLSVDTTYPTSVIDLRPTSLNRVDGGVLSIDAGTLAAVAQPRHVEIHPQVAPTLVGGGAASGPDTSIIPWIVGRWEFLMTHDSTVGLRMLNPDTDFAQSVAAVTAPTNNLRVTTSQAINSPLTVNSLYITEAPEPTGANLSGPGTLTITSGLILTEAFGFSRISAPINFGSAEGIFFNNIGSTLVVSGSISGTGGLTFAGRDKVILEGSNTFTGPIRLARSGIYFNKPEALGADNSAIRIDGGYMYYGGTSDATVTRPIEVSAEGASIGNNSNTGQITYAGVISGPGPLTVGGYDVLLTGNNTFSGGLRINASGTVRFSSDAALGQGGDITFGAGRLEPTFDWVSTRTIYPYFNGGISSGPHNVQLNGPLVGNGDLRKYGTGTLTLRDLDEFKGGISVLEGTLAIDGILPRGYEGTGGGGIWGHAGTKLVGNSTWFREVDVQGTLSPGPGIATLSLSDTELWADSTLELEINSASSFDRLIVATLTLNPLVNLSLTLDYDPVDFVDSFTIVTRSSLPSFPGAAPQLFRYLGNELSEGEHFFVGSQEFQMSYVSGDGNDITIYAVPEPSSALSAVVALCSIFGLRRRRRQEA